MESKTCYVCGKPITTKNEIGLNRKIIGRKSTKFYCYQCLSEQLGIELEELMAKIEEFKSQGCKLFM